MPFANVAKRVGRVVQELEIGFVENRDDVLRHMRHEIVDLILSEQGAGRIVRVGDGNYFRFWRDRVERRCEIVAIIRAWRFNRVRAEKGRDQFVGDEGVLGGDHFIIAIEKGVAEKLDYFVRAIAENDILALEI